MPQRFKVFHWRILFWVTIANYVAQIPYYLYSYYFPHHVIPTASSLVLLGLTLLWFLTGYFRLGNGLKYGHALLLSFLLVEALFYLFSLISGAFLFQIQSPQAILRFVFVVGYISGAIAAYYSYLLLRDRKNCTKIL